MAVWNQGEIVIELAGKKNQQFMFKPLMVVLRGRWTQANVRQTSTNTEIANLPDVPGIMVAVDVKRKTLRAVDPLGFRENKTVLDEVNRIMGRWIGEGRAWDTMTKKNLPEWEIKTALWNMRQFLDEGKAIERSTVKVPQREDILSMPGELKLRYFFSSKDRDQTEFATEEELEIMGAGPIPQIEVTPAGA